MDTLCDQREKGQDLYTPTHFNPLIDASAATRSSSTDEKEEMEREANGAYARMIYSLAKENLTDLYRFILFLYSGFSVHLHSTVFVPLTVGLLDNRQPFVPYG